MTWMHWSRVCVRRWHGGGGGRRLICQWCGKEFTGRKRKYCCSTCCIAARDARATARRRLESIAKKPSEALCVYCGKPLPTLPIRPRTYCDNSCRNKFLRRRVGVGPKQKPSVETQQRTMDILAEQNARQAWDYWIRVLAPDSWLDGYWQATGKPWLDPRLTDAEQYTLKYRLDEAFAVCERMRNQTRKKTTGKGIAEVMRGAIKRNGRSLKVERLLGYSIEDLKEHIERQFHKRMSWRAFLQGRIHIDHIVPQSSYNLSNPEEWRACWALSNLRPLWASDNLRKRDRVETLV